MRRNYFKKNRENKFIGMLICVMLFCVIISACISAFGLIPVINDIDGSFYFNIITIGSIIAGFSFTNSGTIMSMSGSSLEEKLKGTDIIEVCVKRLIHSIAYCCISLIIGMLYGTNILRTIYIIVISTFKVTISTNIINFVKIFCFITSVVSLTIGTVYFCLSLRSVSKLTLKIYKKEESYSTDEIKKAKRILNDQKGNGIQRNQSEDYFRSE